MYQQPEREVLNLKNDYLNLRELLAEIEAKKNRIEELNSLLDDGSNEEIHELTAEKIRIEDLIDLLHNQIDNITNGEDNPFSIKKLEKQLSDLQNTTNTNDAEQSDLPSGWLC